MWGKGGGWWNGRANERLRLRLKMTRVQRQLHLLSCQYSLSLRLSSYRVRLKCKAKGTNKKTETEIAELCLHAAMCLMAAQTTAVYFAASLYVSFQKGAFSWPPPPFVIVWNWPSTLTKDQGIHWHFIKLIKKKKTIHSIVLLWLWCTNLAQICWWNTLGLICFTTALRHISSQQRTASASVVDGIQAARSEQGIYSDVNVELLHGSVSNLQQNLSQPTFNCRIWPSTD